MPLVLRHVRLDLGQFPDLMPQRGGIRSREPRPAPPACRGPERLGLVAVFRRNQRPIVRACSRPEWWRPAKGGGSRCSSAVASMPARIFGMFCSAARPTCRLRSRCAMPCPVIDHPNSRRFLPTAWRMRGRGRPLSEPDSHLRAQRWQSVRIPDCSPAACRCRRRCSGRVDALELP
jgi:hypothetical protein